MSPRSRKQLAALISMFYTFLNIILATIELDVILMVAVIKWTEALQLKNASVEQYKRIKMR